MQQPNLFSKKRKRPTSRFHCVSKPPVAAAGLASRRHSLRRSPRARLCLERGQRPTRPLHLVQQRTQEKQLKNEIQDLQQENTHLRQHVDHLKNDPDAIEHEAREKLHYASPAK